MIRCDSFIVKYNRPTRFNGPLLKKKSNG